MKKYVAVVLLICFIFMLNLSAEKSYADGLTMNMVSTASYALMNQWGIGYTVGSGTSAGINNFMQGQIDDYLADSESTLAEKFGVEAMRLTAGKLIIGQNLYNGVKDFVDWFVNKFGNSESGDNIADGIYDGEVIPSAQKGSESYTGVGLEIVVGDAVQSGQYTLYHNIAGYNNGTSVFSDTKGGIYAGFTGDYEIIYSSGNLVCRAKYYAVNTGRVSYYNYTFVSSVSLDNSISYNAYNYVSPSIINTGQEWQGDVEGYTSPDTNLDQLMQGILEGVVDGDISVDGQVVEPAPAPTPIPTYGPIDPDTPLSDVPYGGLNDLLGQTEQGINSQIQSQTQSITGAQEATTEAVESLTDTITEALDVPDAEELPDFKFDLRELFPFCIPFDIYRLLSSFDAEPEAPHVQLPIVINSINFRYNLDLDFSAWNPVAQAMRTAELIVYAIGLAWATGKVIKW